MAKWLVQKALLDGDGPEKFHTTAQRYANSTWFWIITAVAVWYFFGWGWAILPAALALAATGSSILATRVAYKLEELKEPKEQFAGAQIENIVRTYGQFLESSAPLPGCVADVTKLPFPKEDIKTALKAAMHLSNPSERTALATGYVSLASWQEGVGPDDMGLDISKLSDQIAPQKQAQMVLDMVESSHVFMDQVKAEEASLWQELTDSGLI